MTVHAADDDVEANRFAGISAYLSRNRVRLDGLLAEVARLVDLGSCGAAGLVYASFDAGLRRHIRLEEQILFPVFETRTGLTGGPTATMRLEHREIERSLDLMAEALDAADADRFRDGLSFLRSVALGHHSKEENILYPMIERLVNASERRTLMALLLRS